MFKLGEEGDAKTRPCVVRLRFLGMAERPPIGLAMLFMMSLSVSGADALSGLNGAMPWLNKSAAQGTPT